MEYFAKFFGYVVEYFPLLALGGFIYALLDLGWTIWRGRKTKRELINARRSIEKALASSDKVRAELESQTVHFSEKIKVSIAEAASLGRDLLDEIKLLTEENTRLREEIATLKARLKSEDNHE